MGRSEMLDRGLDKANAKILYHKSKIAHEYADRKLSHLAGYDALALVRFHIKELRTWQFIRATLIHTAI